MTDTISPASATPPVQPWSVTERLSTTRRTTGPARHELPTEPLLVVAAPGHSCERTCTGCAIVLAVTGPRDAAGPA